MEKHTLTVVGLIVTEPLLLTPDLVKLNAIVLLILIKFVELMELLIEITVMPIAIESLQLIKETVPKTALNAIMKFSPLFVLRADCGTEINVLQNVTDKSKPKISGVKELSTDYLTE